MQQPNLKDIVGKRLDEKFPGFKTAWNDLVKKVGDDFVNLLKEKFQDDYQLFKEISQFKISVVVDNNFVFGQIKNLAEKSKPLESSFVYRIANLKSVKVYAPPKQFETKFQTMNKRYF